MSVGMWNCHSWPLDVSSMWIIWLFWIGSHYIHSSANQWSAVTGSFQWGVHHLTVSNGLSLQTFISWWSSHLCSIDWASISSISAKFSIAVFKALTIFDYEMSVAMWNCHSWPLDVSSNVKLSFLTTRCQ